MVFITSTWTFLANLVLFTSSNHCDLRIRVGTEIRILILGFFFHNLWHTINAPYDFPTPVLQTQIPFPLLFIHLLTPNSCLSVRFIVS